MMAQGMPHGFLLGKFLPPTMGHKFLVDFAAAQCRRVSVLVCTRRSDPVAGALRHAWMREAFPALDVIHHSAEIQEYPHGPDDRAFYDLWRDSIAAHVRGPISHVYASEPYGADLAAALGAAFVPVDLGRVVVPISATQVRAAPLAHWDMILPQARSHFVKRVCIFGPESTGKTTLAARLARAFDTRHVPEYARALLDAGGRCDYEDIPLIAAGQVAAEDAAAKQARGVVVCDTDPLTTTIWSRWLFGRVPAEVEALAAARSYDLTLLCDIDCPWVDDGQRYYGDPDMRARFMADCRATLQAARRPYVVLNGDWDARFDAACAAIRALLRPS
ncbi:AAA family ATPase [Zavarzinia sp. CC-PAN008]|uniref:AAA family ATPase n=1 Tax=Zavarzinia sp. CC-PAN008 TaxID=3243332 RepID=UPI003F7442F0